MQKKLKFVDEIDLPIDLLMQTIALLGNKGAGKTYGGMALFEAAHAADVQCGAIDSIGKWWGLLLSASGKGLGLKGVYLFGGRRGDFPLLPDKGAFIAKLVVEKNLSFILDVSLMRKAERRRFLTDFCEEFYLLKKTQDAPNACMLFLEEAHNLAPQKPYKGEEALLGAVEDLVREGRNVGIGVVLLDQRSATLNKNVLALAEVLLSLRTTWADDREVHRKWVVGKGAEERKDWDKELPTLKAGHGFLYVPTEGIFQRVHISKRWTFDSSATAKVGVVAKAIGKLTRKDVAKVKEAMAEVEKEAAENNPATLRARVRELEGKLAQAERRGQIGLPLPDTEAEREKRAHWAKLLRKEFAKAHDKAFNLMTKGERLQEKLVDTAKALFALKPEIAAVALALSAAPKTLPASHAPAALAPREPLITKAPTALQTVYEKRRAEDAARAPREPSQRALPPGELAVLTAAIQFSGVDGDQISVLTGYKRSSRDAYIARLIARGYVTRDGGLIRATSEARLAVPSVEPLPVGQALRTYWRERLPEGEQAVLDAVTSAHPTPISREEIDAVLQQKYKRSSRDAYLARLGSRRLVITPSRGMVAASPTLFEG